MNARFSTRHLLAHSWHLVLGSKRQVFWLLFVMFIVFFVVNWGELIVEQSLGLNAQNALSWENSIATFILFLVMQFIMAPFIAGGFMIGIKKARDGSRVSGLSYLHQWLSTGATLVILTLLVLLISAIIFTPFLWGMNKDWQMLFATAVLVGMVVLLLWGIPLMMFALSLVVDKEVLPLTAIWHSIKVLVKHYFRIMFSLFLMVMLNVLVFIVLAILHWLLMRVTASLTIPELIEKAGVALGILVWIGTLLWTMPMSFMMWGVLYRYLIDHSVSV